MICESQYDRRRFCRTLGGLLVPIGFPAIIRAASFSDSLAFRSQGSGVSLSSKTLDWATRVQTNGDPYPTALLSDVNVWYNGLVADSLDPDIYECSFMAPGPTKITTLTPFYKTFGIDPWTFDGGAAPTPVTANGLPTVGSVTAINTGVVPSSVVTGTSMGITKYSGTNTVGQAPDFQAGGGGGGRFAVVYSNTVASYAPFQLNWTLGIFGLSGGSLLYGFVSVNRTGANQLDVYGANGSTAFQNIGTSAAAAAGALPSGGLMCFGGLPSCSGWPYAYSAGNFWTIICIHKGWNSTKAQAFFNRCQTLRMSSSFNGGFT